MLYLTCSTILRVKIARYGVPRAQDLGIWEMWYKLSCLCAYGLQQCGHLKSSFQFGSVFKFKIENTGMGS